MSALKLYFQNKLLEAGCDEAGRGCLAGPVCAAAVILPNDLNKNLLKDLNDSKKLKESVRYELRPIIEKIAISFSVAMIDQKKIDEINILNASFLAMHHAIDKLNAKPELLLIDGNRFKKYSSIPHQCIIKGDGKYLSIAAASILAKTYRDDHMNHLHEKFPQYNWKKNKAYGTAEHRAAIEQYGITDHHRKSFRLLPDQLKIKF